MKQCRWLLLAGLLLWPQPLLAQESKSDPGRTYSVPYKLTDTVHVLVRAKINGKGPFHFIIDTGAPINFVSAEIGKKLGLKADKTGWTTLDRLEIEGGPKQEHIKVRVETPFQLQGMNAMNFAGVELHGILGYPLLAQYRLEFDFQQPKMRWTHLKYQPPPPIFLSVKSGEAGGLNALGTVMKVLSMIVGKRPSPELVPGGFLGIELAEKNAHVAIVRILPNSPAAKAGLQAGDIVLEVQDQTIDTIADLRRRTARITPGQDVRFHIRRGQDKQQIRLTAGKGL